MTIRDHMHPEVGGLGRKVETPKPVPEPVPVGNGVVRDPDGKLRTEIPENEAASGIPWIPPLPKLAAGDPAAWPFPTGPQFADAIPAGLVGDEEA